MRARDVLLNSLQEYTGTIVFVSHDRYFLDKLATRVFEVEDGRVHIYPGNYEDYMWRKSGGPEQLATQQRKNGTPAPAPAPAPAAKSAEKRLNPMKLESMKKRQGELEGAIAATEGEIAECEAALGNFVSVEETMRLSDLVEQKRAGLQKLMTEWEALGETIEAGS